MKIVNINNIEDIVLTKYEIENNNPDKNEKSELNDFIRNYCVLNDALVNNNDIIPFRYIEVYDKKYLFISDNNYIDDITKILVKIKYDFNNLKEIVNYFDYNLTNTNKIHMIVHNGKYYQIP